MTNLFFKYLNWILKVDKNKPEYQKVSTFMVNRWLSMTTKSIAQIVNSTTNRWRFEDQDNTITILHGLVPKYNKKIDYIKKASTELEEEPENFENLCFCMEISKKELRDYDLMLEELGLINK